MTLMLMNTSRGLEVTTETSSTHLSTSSTEEFKMIKHEGGETHDDDENTPRAQDRRENTIGILRLDAGKPRRSSGSSVEFRMGLDGKLDPQCDLEPASPQPSVDRLSVTFATEERSVCSDSSVKVNFFTPSESSPMDKVRFNRDQTITDGEEEEEDYSASVSAILQRRASQKRQSSKRRRPSSPLFSPDADTPNCIPRRRSSAFTTSSGDTAISVDEGTTQEQIFVNIKLHKEVLSSVKQQALNMRRKVKLVQQAKAYVKRHEGELQERLAQSKSTRDILARFNIVLIKHWQYLKRELANLMNVLIPWELRIKEIESHFGSVVASYFTFLRWLFWVNLAIAVVLIAFVAVPEILTADVKNSGERKIMLPNERKNATNLFTLWDFDGVLKYSPLFYGYYSTQVEHHSKIKNTYSYHLPLAYFITELAVYVYSFVAILRKMAENSRQSKLSEKDDECIFTWKLFTGWDYMIGNAETAHNRTASIILGFKEALLEEAERKRDEGRNWKITSLRVFANINMVWLLGTSVYAVMWAVERSTQPEANIGWWRQNEVTLVLNLITSVFPVLFEALGVIEGYHPRKKLRMQLARIMALNLLNLYAFIFASFSKINDLSLELQSLKKNLSTSKTNSTTFTTLADEKQTTFSPFTNLELNPTTTLSPSTVCYNVPVPCTTQINNFSTAITIASLLIGSTTLPTNIMGSSTEVTNSQPQTESTTTNTNIYTDENISTPNFTLYSQDQTLSTKQMLETLAFNETFYETSSNNITSVGENFSFTTQEFTTDATNTTSLINVTDIYYNNYSQFEEFATNQSINNDYEDTTVSEYPYELFQSTTVSPENLMENKKKITLSTGNTQTVYTNILNKSTQFTSEYTPVPSSCYITECRLIETSLTSTFSSTTTNFESPFDNEIKSFSSVSTEPDAPRDLNTTHLDEKTRKRLRGLCWETMFGRELVKITVMELVMTVVTTITMDFFRALFVRVMNNCWCWDLEKKFPQYGDFKIAENILQLVNNQGFVWMGMFFSPGLPLINLFKLVIIMYIRSWAVLTCNVPHEVVFRASRSNNFYLALLLTMLFLCVLPVGYAIVWVEPSWHCGPFSKYKRIYFIFTKSLKKALPKSLHKSLDYIASPGIVIPLLMLLVLIIYYLISLTSALREANNDLKIQLRRERTEERRKMFQLVDRRRHGGNEFDTFSKWRKILPNLPLNKTMLPDIPLGNSTTTKPMNGSVKLDTGKNKEHLARLVKKARKKSVCTSEDEGMHMIDGDGTDAEQHESLPDDNKSQKKSKKVKSFHNIVAAVHKKSTNSEKDKLQKVKEKCKDKNHTREKSPSIISTTSTFREREDSVASGWSDNIPKIRISQNDSSHEEEPGVENLEFESTVTLIANKDKKLAKEFDNVSERKNDCNKTITINENINHDYQNSNPSCKAKSKSNEDVSNSAKKQKAKNKINRTNDQKNYDSMEKNKEHGKFNCKIDVEVDKDKITTNPEHVDTRNDQSNISFELKQIKSNDHDESKKRRKLLIKLKNAVDNTSECNPQSGLMKSVANKSIDYDTTYNSTTNNETPDISSDSDCNSKLCKQNLHSRKNHLYYEKGKEDINTKPNGDEKMEIENKIKDVGDNNKSKETNAIEQITDQNHSLDKSSKTSYKKSPTTSNRKIRQFKEFKSNCEKHDQKEDIDNISGNSDSETKITKPEDNEVTLKKITHKNIEKFVSDIESEFPSESEESDESPPTMVKRIESGEKEQKPDTSEQTDTKHSDKEKNNEVQRNYKKMP